mmetsp:Transcript_17734/g.44244  ORF Transcript_17734/g.44244 Transcript_17734/m.44244 type:complete len:224 (+) Transcript_17734:1263-1934(+)
MNGRVEGSYTQTPGVSANATREGNLVVIASSGFHHHSRHQWEQGDILNREQGQVDSEIDVSNTRGRTKFVSNHGNSGFVFVLGYLDWVFGDFSLEISEFQGGNSSAILGGIFRGLEFLQFVGGLDHFFDVGIRHGVLDLLQFVLFFLQQVGFVCFGWLHLNCGSVIVLDEEFLDHVLENFGSILGNAVFELGEGFLELESFRGRLVVQPFAHGTKHETQSLGV